MKTKLCSMMALLVCVAYLACSCTPTTTWRQIRSNPQKYARDQVCMKGRVERVEWNTQEKHGDLIVRDRNRDTGPVRFYVKKDWRGPGMKVVVVGNVRQEQQDTGSQTYLLLCGYKEPPEWWQTAREIPEAAATVATGAAHAALAVAALSSRRCTFPSF